MRVLFAATPGLLADTFSFWLSKLSSNVQVVRCETNPANVFVDGSGFELALFDVDGLPAETALSAVRGFREILPDTPLAVTGSALDDGFVLGVANAGADGYLPKSYGESQALGVLVAVIGGTSRQRLDSGTSAVSADPQIAAIASRGDRRNMPYGLTVRELEVLELASSGLSNLEISKRCGITEGVVKIHLHHAYRKLGVQGRLQAARIIEHLDGIRQLQIQRSEDGASLLGWLLPHMSYELQQKGQMLFRKGALGDALYYIQQGRVRLPEIDVEMVEGDLFGEIGIFAPEHARTCSARCETDVHLFRLTAEQAKRLCFENPQFAYFVIRLIADRLVGERAKSR